MGDSYPPYEPYDHGLLDVGDGNSVYWDVSGDPAGEPVIIVHGGPGGGASTKPHKTWDPARYRVIRYDQRGCGRSTPNAADPATDLSVNTTEHLLADLELLRAHFGVERWLMFGGSWGSTLVLAYAERHPERVTGIILPSMMASSRAEIDWLYGDLRRIFPEAWHRFREGVPEEYRDGDILRGYAHLMESPDPDVRAKAAVDWLAWEDAVISQEANGKPGQYSDRASVAQQAFVRICAHYFGNAAWLEEGILVREAGKLAGIPGVIVQGRNDLGCPPGTAWELAQAWPDAKLVIVEDSGHTGSPTFAAELGKAVDELIAKL